MTPRPALALVLALASALPALGCARTVVSGRPAGAGPTGVRVYPPKPYLALLRLPSPAPSGATHEARLLLLPDLEHPQYLHVRAGLGVVRAEVTLADGMLAAYEESDEGRLLETVEAAGRAASRLLATGAAQGGRPSDVDPIALFEIVPTDDGGVDLREVPRDRVRALLGRARTTALDRVLLHG